MNRNRRDFLKHSAAGLFGGLSLARASQAAPDYRALVCIFLYGGNDGNNTVIPLQTRVQSYQHYAGIRKGLALAANSLLPVPAAGGQDLYGLHPAMQEIQQLYLARRAAVLANVGVLVKPLTRSEFLQPGTAVPENLFSHSDQQQQWETGAPRTFGSGTGWAGRAADVMQPQNAPATFPMITSLTGAHLALNGETTRPSILYPDTIPALDGYNGYQPSASRLASFQKLLTFDNGLSLVQAANALTARGINDGQLLAQALAGAPPLTTVFPNTRIGSQLRQAARLIRIRQALGLKRQIFFCSMDTFDTHGDQLYFQNELLLQLSQAVGAFYQATQEMGIEDKVTTFTESEFGRTLQPSSHSGTDHAWGNHHFVVGGAVRGGEVYGQFPELALGGPNDANTRGVWIPGTSLEQYGATLAAWFGASPSELAAIFPTLANFPAANLGFV